jgi:hypothetical protein
MSTDLTVHDARVLTAQIRESVAGVWDLIVEAYTSRAWTSLGYDSWDDYTRTEFDGVRIALPREDRREVVGSLRDAGLSTRAIAAATGVSVGTVAGDLSNRSEMNSSPPVIIGTDGKSRPAHVTTTTRTTEATKVEHDVDLETGEITSPGSRAPLQDSAPGVEQLSAEPGALDPIAAAKAEAAKSPHVLAHKAIDRYRDANQTVNAAGGIDVILTETRDYTAAQNWAKDLEDAIDIAETWLSAIRRQHLRSV